MFFKKDSCQYTAALMQPQQREGTVPLLLRVLPSSSVTPPPPVRHREPGHGLYWATKQGSAAILTQLPQQMGSRLGSRVESLHVEASLPANAVAKKCSEFRQCFRLCQVALKMSAALHTHLNRAQPQHEPKYCLEWKLKITEEREMQNKVSIKAFFLLQSCVIQQRLAVNKNQKTMHFSTGSVIKSPLSYDHGTCRKKHLCVCVFSKEKEFKKRPSNQNHVSCFDTDF